MLAFAVSVRKIWMLAMNKLEFIHYDSGGLGVGSGGSLEPSSQIYHIIIRKQSRPWSGSSHKSCLVWVCSVWKSGKRRLYEVNG